MKKNIKNFSYILKALEKSYKKSKSPSVTLIANTLKTPFHILISTLVSLRTKDKVTLNVSKRIFEKVSSFKEIKKISIKELEKMFYPAGFYKTKAKRLKEIADIIENEKNGRIPDTIEELLKLPGVGRKTANLVVSLGFNKPGLCVDTHVHRITNRLGWVRTKTPEQTEFALRELLPLKYWRKINDYLVSYGQTIANRFHHFVRFANLMMFVRRLMLLKEDRIEYIISEKINRPLPLVARDRRERRE